MRRIASHCRRPIRPILAACVCLLCTAVRGTDEPAAAVDTASLDRQQRARQKAADLVTSVIDVQLRQLEENGLTSSPIHAEVAAMRRTIDGLVQREMQSVVDALAGGAATPAEMSRIRAQVRAIVIRLAEERHKLLRRLKVADLAAQVRRLIGLEAAALGAVRDLPRATTNREEKILQSLDSQRTVRTLCERLESDLVDMREWGGLIGEGAADGLRLLRVGDLRGSLQSAEERLQAADFPGTTAAQERVIATLESLSVSIEKTQGVVGNDSEQAVLAVRAAIAKVETVRKEIAASPLDDAAVERLIAAQADVQKQVAALEPLVAGRSAAAPLVQQAKQGVAAVTAAVFEADRPQADAAAGQVLGNLREITAALESQDRTTGNAMSAMQFAERLAALEKARTRAADATAFGRQAEQAVATDARAAARAAAEVAKVLAPTAADKPLPAAVSRRLAEAQDEAAEAARDLGKPQTDKAAASVGEVNAALERARSEIEAAIADTKRAASAVKIGELNRAAETLERAAAAQEKVADQARAVAEPEARTDDAATLAAARETEKKLAAVAANVAEAVRDTAPAAAAAVEAARQPMAAVDRKLAVAADRMTTADPARQRPEETRRAAAEAAAEADKAADQLADAARTMRAEIARTAAELSAVAAEQLQPVTAVAREATALAEQGNRVQEARAALEQLAEARNAIKSAQAEQARATNRADPMAQQRVSDLAQEAAKAVTPAASAQPQAAEAARALADAARASAEAERRMAEGGQAVAEPQQQSAAALAKADKSLADAVQAAERKMAAALEAQAAQAEQLADKAAAVDPSARAALDRAAEEAREAAQLGGQQPEGQPTASPPAQAGGASPAEQAANPQQFLERAQASLAARESAIRQAAELAAQMQSGAAAQQQARDRIEALAEQMEQQAANQTASAPSAGQPGAPPEPRPPGEQAGGQSPSPATAQTAGQLQQAQQQFAQAQEQVGMAAADVSGQQQVANQPLLEALAMASQMAGQPGPQEQQSQEVPSGQQEPQQAQSQQPGQPGQPAQDQGQAPSQEGQPAAQQMGQGFAPPSAMATAEMIAGQQAQQAAAQALQPQAPQSGQASQSQSQSQSASTAMTGNEDLNRTSGMATTGVAADSTHDATAGPPPVEKEPWFAKLPPDQQESIRTKARRPAPRGYEEKLRRYFDSIGQ